MTSQLANDHIKPWALYGATGVTGRLVLARALSRGHRPILIGRDAARLAVLAEPYGLAVIEAGLDDATALAAALAGCGVLVNAAGPFTRTGAPLIAAALATGTDYLDLNGELGPLEALLARDADARAAGIALVGGAGFGVAATDGLAARVVATLGGADWLRLSVAADSGYSSPAVAESTLAVIEGGGREVEDGAIRRRALGRRRWTARVATGETVAFASAPLAELAAARHATGVAAIVAGVPMAAGQALALSILAPILPLLLRLQPVRAAMAGAGGHAAGTAPKTEFHSRVVVDAGRGDRRAVGRLEAGEGYATAAAIAVAAVERVLTRRPAPGAHTPATAFGEDFIGAVPGVTVTFETL